MAVILASLLDIEVGCHRCEHEKEAGVSWELVGGTHRWAGVEREEVGDNHRTRPCLQTWFYLS